MEKSRVTEIQVRMDCNGCIQKIKKALHGINGIQDIHIDIPHQKLTIIGCADPEIVVKAIKKARKHATIICSEPKPSENGAPPEPPKEREVPGVSHYPPDHSNRFGHDQVYNASVTHYSSSPSPRYKHERLQQPVHVNHSYNTYKPTCYVTEYTHIHPPPQNTHYGRPEPPLHYTHYKQEPPHPYANCGPEEPTPRRYVHHGNDSITSIFSDDNPNACTIV